MPKLHLSERFLRYTKRLRCSKKDLSQAILDESHLSTGHTTCVLFVNGCDLPDLRRYRVLHQREQLELWGYVTEEAHYLSVSPDDALRAEVFIIYRCPYTEGVGRFIEQVHRLGKKVYYDVDDLVIDTSYTGALPVVASMAEDERIVFNDGVTRNGKTLALCDGAIVTTERLAFELGRTVPVTLINRNVASLDMISQSDEAIRRSKRNDGKIILGYFSGSMTHNDDFTSILPAITHVMATRPNVYLKVVGDLILPKELERFSSRIIRSEKVPWEELPNLIASADINLAPIVPNLFNEGKSENKWTEAALVNVPTVATDFGAFKQVIQHGRTGYLCKTSEEWVDALLKLIDDDAHRLTIGKQARDDVLLHHSTRSTGYTLASFLFSEQPELINLCAKDIYAKEGYINAYLASRGLSGQETNTTKLPEQISSHCARMKSIAHSLSRGVETALLVYERGCGDDATFRYFGLNVAERLEQSYRFHGIPVYIDELNDIEHLLDKIALVVLIRCRIRPELIQLKQVAAHHGVRIAYLIDDNAIGVDTSNKIIDIMAANPSSQFERSFWKGVTLRFDLASRLADCLIVPNGYFASLLQKKQDKPVYVIHSSLNDKQVLLSESINHSHSHSADNRFIIGYFSGTSSHQADFALIEDTIVGFIRSHPNASLLLGGSLCLTHNLLSLWKEGRLIPMPPVPYPTLQALQASVDVVLAPLVVDEFTNCKSALKVFEAGVVKTPACASPSYSYKEAIDHGTTGFICSSPAEWLISLARLQESRCTAIDMGERAYVKSLSDYYGNTILNEIESAFSLAKSVPIINDSAEIAHILERVKVNDWDAPFLVNPQFCSLDDL